MLISYSPLSTCLTPPPARELDASGAVVSRTGYRMGGCIARFVTDFLVTQHYYVVLQVGTRVLYSRAQAQVTAGAEAEARAQCVCSNLPFQFKFHTL